MGQMYAPLSIGTAKPNWKSQLIAHHLFDIIAQPRNITVSEYRALVINAVTDIQRRGKIPLLVGGSGFYLKSLLYPPLEGQVQQPQADYVLDSQDLWEQLHAIDPDRAVHIHPNDAYRLKRALTIWHTTGQKPSELQPQFNAPFAFNLVGLTADLPLLYERIYARVQLMIDQGWIEEVRALLGTEWEPFLKEKKIIGYDDIIDYLRNPLPPSLQQVTEAIAQKTRNYAKRQLTFWRMLSKQVQEDLPKKLQHDTLMQSNVHEIYLTQFDASLIVQSMMLITK